MPLAAACSGTLTRIDTPQLQSGLSLNAFVGSAVVQTVSLPSYASAEELSVESAPGVITTTDDLLWADEPERAMTLMVARQLDDILTATVGPDVVDHRVVGLHAEISERFGGIAILVARDEAFGTDHTAHRVADQVFEHGLAGGAGNVVGARIVARGEGSGGSRHDQDTHR